MLKFLAKVAEKYAKMTNTACGILVIFHQFVDGARWSQFDDAVGHSLYELMVVTGKDDITLKLHQVVVEGLDAFEVEMVGGSVENEAVGIFELHSCNHTSHLLTTAEHVHLLLHILVLEEHTSEEALHLHLVALAILAEPIHKVEVALEE